MQEIGCDAIDGYVRLTHAITVNDTFWIKREDEDINWEQVSPYRNPFNKTISKFAFDGIELYDKDAVYAGAKPELNCDGGFPKCFRKERSLGQYGSDIFIYKRTQGDGIMKIEPYSESLCSEIANIISPNNSVYYDVTTLHNKIASRCNLFTDEKYGYASYSKIFQDNRHSLGQVFDYFYQIGSEQEFREMLVIDALCFNQDRHQGNFGVLFDNDTLEVIKMSPSFDFNITMLTYATDEELQNVGDKIWKGQYAPKLGDDFTELGQIGMNDIIRERIKDMRDFRFTFRGDENFSETRVRLLEEIVQKQASAIIKNEKLQTKDVFFSQERFDEEIRQEKEQAEREQCSKEMQEFLEFYEIAFIDADYLISTCDDPATTELYLELPDGISVTVDFYGKTITGYDNFKPVALDKIDFSDDKALLYDNILEAVKQLQKGIIIPVEKQPNNDMPNL